MRIALAKPGWGIVGGFERVIERIVAMLRGHGHEVTRFDLPVNDEPAATVFGVPISPAVWHAAAEFFRHAALVERFAALDLDDHDVVITTQPGSHAVQHDHKLAVFYHHLRIAYDLEARFATSGLPGSDLASEMAAAVRRLDRPHLASVDVFLTPSETVRDRLRRFNDVDDTRMLPFLAGPIAHPPTVETAPDIVTCVSRHEFGKRTELFVDAAFAGFGGRIAHSVGSGGLQRWVEWRAERRATGEAVPTTEPWIPPPASTADRPSLPVVIHGAVSDQTLADLYQRTACLVAPAYDEDYGLTAIEAQRAGIPVVVCDDGGSLAELVVDGETGRVVEPSGEAIAAAVRQICDDETRWKEMSAAAAEHGSAFTWERAERQLLAGLEAVAP
jgi:glycosyltransferase involved in cell wall biosynthesis